MGRKGAYVVLDVRLDWHRAIYCISGLTVRRDGPCASLLSRDAISGKPIWLLKDCPENVDCTASKIADMLARGETGPLVIEDSTRTRRRDCDACQKEWEKQLYEKLRAAGVVNSSPGY